MLSPLVLELDRVFWLPVALTFVNPAFHSLDFPKMWGVLILSSNFVAVCWHYLFAHFPSGQDPSPLLGAGPLTSSRP